MANFTNNKVVVEANIYSGVDYKDVERLKAHILESGRIIPGRITNVSPRKQRQIAKAVKLARYLALLPYTDQH